MSLMQSLIILQSLIHGAGMASMTIRNIDELLKRRLRLRAATNGRSMEDEARDILRAALFAQHSRTRSLVDAIRRRIEPLGGVDLEIPPREPMRDPVKLQP